MAGASTATSVGAGALSGAAAGSVVPVIGTALGAIIGAAGAWFSSKGQDKKAKQLKALANTPGIDFGSITNESLDDMLAAMPGAEKVSRGVAEADQRTLQSILEDSIPGYKDIQAERSDNALDLLRGDLPDSVWDSINRRSAGGSLAGGISGSPIGFGYGRKMMGDETLRLMGIGNDMAQGLISGTPRANSPGAESFLGPSAGERIQIRSNERSQKLGFQGQAIAAGGASNDSIVGSFLKTMGTATFAGLFDDALQSGVDSLNPPNVKPENYGSLGLFNQMNYNQLYAGNQRKYGNGDQFQ